MVAVTDCRLWVRTRQAIARLRSQITAPAPANSQTATNGPSEPYGISGWWKNRSSRAPSPQPTRTDTRLARASNSMKTNMTQAS